jgi:hypothetical protein
VKNEKQKTKTRKLYSFSGLFLICFWGFATALKRDCGSMVPLVGIELTTYRLQGGCSTN